MPAPAKVNYLRRLRHNGGVGFWTAGERRFLLEPPSEDQSLPTYFPQDRVSVYKMPPVPTRNPMHHIGMSIIYFYWARLLTEFNFILQWLEKNSGRFFKVVVCLIQTLALEPCFHAKLWDWRAAVSMGRRNWFRIKSL